MVGEEAAQEPGASHAIPARATHGDTVGMPTVHVLARAGLCNWARSEARRRALSQCRFGAQPDSGDGREREQQSFHGGNSFHQAGDTGERPANFGLIAQEESDGEGSDRRSKVTGTAQGPLE